MADVRYLVDENVSGAIVQALRRRGISVLTPIEEGLLAASDQDYLARARDLGCVVVTHDDDFLRLHAAGAEHGGIVYNRQGSRSVSEVVAGLVLIHDVLTAEDMVGQVEFL